MKAIYLSKGFADTVKAIHEADPEIGIEREFFVDEDGIFHLMKLYKDDESEEDERYIGEVTYNPNTDKIDYRLNLEESQERGSFHRQGCVVKGLEELIEKFAKSKFSRRTFLDPDDPPEPILDNPVYLNETYNFSIFGEMQCKGSRRVIIPWLGARAEENGEWHIVTAQFLIKDFMVQAFMLLLYIEKTDSFAVYTTYRPEEKIRVAPTLLSSLETYS